MVGLPKIVYESAPPFMPEPPTCTLMAKLVVLDKGVVAKLNEVPLFTDVNVMDALALDEAKKSVASAVVAPADPLTLMVQLITPPARRGEALLHTSDDAVVGLPYTTYVG